MSQKIYRDIIRDGKVLRGQIFVPFNGKIADITHADTSKHTLDLATALGETRKIIGIEYTNNRVAGTGLFNVYPNEGALANAINTSWLDLSPSWVIIKDGTQRLQYSLSVASDDWDLYCFGYVVEA